MTEYQLPEPTPCGYIAMTEYFYNADQMQQAYAAGREAMRQECVKFFQALAGTNWTAGTVADTIKELK